MEETTYIPYIERYFTKYISTIYDNQCVLRHLNQFVCLICINENLAKTLTDFRFEYKVKFKSFTGKRKHDAMQLSPTTILAEIQFGETKLMLRSCVFGKLLELNSNIDNELIRTKSERDGYLAIVGTSERQWHKSLNTNGERQEPALRKVHSIDELS
ncbi:hypothetical protein GJ496_007799 [Pomphorhynchus laevis]|nr:hypothetical protein GJ496_007799 [Pomphorhynchus laevis]